jgi:hypothetical protein
MMKRLLAFLIFLLCPFGLWAQTGSTGRTFSGPAIARPTCNASITFNNNANPGDWYNDTDDAGVFKCMGGNWGSLGGGGGGGGMVFPPAGVPLSTGVAWAASYSVGVLANNLLQLTNTGALPAVSAANLTNFPTFNQNTTGTAANLSGTPALPNGTTATTQAPGDNSTKLATTAYSDAHSGLPTETQFCAPFYATTTTLNCVSSPAGPGLFSLLWNPSSSTPVALTQGQVGQKSNAITGAQTTLTGGILWSHVGQVIEHDQGCSANVNQALPTATTLGNTAFQIKYSNHCPGHTDTITPTTWTITKNTAAPAASMTVGPGEFCTITVDTNSATNWLADCILTVAGTLTIASGTKALSTAAIGSGACTAAQTATATGSLSTDGLITDFNADPTAVTGYIPSTNGMLTIIPYLTADTFNVKVCNNTSASITPGAITLTFRVVR